MLPFRVATIGEYHCSEDFYVDRSGYEVCLLMYTISGKGLLKYEGKTYDLLPGQAVVIDCRKNQYYAACRGGWDFLWFHLEGESAFEYVKMFNETDASPLEIGSRLSFENYYGRFFFSISRFDLRKELEMSSLAHEMLTRMITMKSFDGFHECYAQYRREMEESVLMLNEHFREKMTVENMAQRCHVSKPYFIKMFKAYTGQTPYDYLLGLRLSKAQEELTQSTASVAQIALESGFLDSKNLILHFKKRFGITPLQYRKRSG